MTLEVWSGRWDRGGPQTRSPSPSHRLPRQVPSAAWVGSGWASGPPGTQSAQGPAGPCTQPGLLCVWDAPPSPLQAWTQVAGTVPVDPQRVGLAQSWLQGLLGEGLHHLDRVSRMITDSTSREGRGLLEDSSDTGHFLSGAGGLWALLSLPGHAGDFTFASVSVKHFITGK